MRMTHCAKCQAPMSKNAWTCPKCAYPPSWNLGKCRSCDTVLANSNHRYSTRSRSAVVDGNSVGARKLIMHLPCPNCGEQRPLLKLWDRGLIKFLYYLLCIPVIFIMFLVMLSPNGLGLPGWLADHITKFLHITKDNMNWTLPLLGAVVLVASVPLFVFAHRRHTRLRRD
jgi:hypothetical protein